MPTSKPDAKSSAQIQGMLERLELVHGRSRRIPRFDPMEELVSCILSQHTADVNSFPAFTRLRATFPDWQAVVDAGPDRLSEVIRKAGLANQKARNIIASLSEIHARVGAYSLECLRGMELLEARRWLTTLPGVGPKTASIVLCFGFGMGAIPVDTHVFRVCWRLGLYDKSVGEAKAHDVLLRLVPPELAYRFHTAVIQHGRAICRAQKPSCSACVLSEGCQWAADERRAKGV